ncbi:MAG: bifunctional 2-polyprenyl-6-hydroxyphenol methylase/3-demethylubiquinol 3-O-methyltransferase UbiG [Alphaproteobacteria bacterium]|nr:bifunctional 2-polyprenyl-6-hydroxyphenol methylase/3-demethylubiquinol 3-O-methyltransferase UbiG [Alphaproteobacteria bacterium]
MSSIDTAEIENFSKDADRWWDENGPFKPLHHLNPVRMRYIKEQICEHFDKDPNSLKSLKHISILDVGCGGGLVCEPLARLGADVTGADADPVAISTAKEHSLASGLAIDYQRTPAEKITKKYDVVLALEIIEHVQDPEEFVKTIAGLSKKDGLVIFSTLNRNPKSFLLGIVAAEYFLRWVPRGTHSWKKFIRPSELAKMGRQAALSPKNITGLIYNPVRSEFALSNKDLDVNYLMALKKT